MRRLIPIPILLLLLASAHAAEDDPVLLVSRGACFVHGLRAWPAAGDAVERVVAPGHTLLHTSRVTGMMTRLVEATGTVAINTRRISYRVSRVLGVAADAERLYALLWHSSRIYDRPPAQGASLEGGRYELRVFWLGDGNALTAPLLTSKGLPATAPEASLGRGPLRLVKDGVSCYGTTGRYDGRTRRGS